MSHDEPRRRFERVLVATDFSADAAHALARALALPLDASSRIDVVHFVPYEANAVREARAVEDGRRALDRALADAAPGASRVAIRSDVLVGNPAVEILRRARELDTDLVVLGRRRRRRGVIRHALGRTSTRAVRFGEWPVLLVSRRPDGPYRRPLLATDLEDAPHRLARLAAAALPGDVSHLRAVHAFGTRAAAGPTSAEHREALRRMRGFVAAAQAPLAIEPVVRAGGAGRVILDEVRRTEADLLIVGAYHQSAATRALLGSVTEYVVGSTECDVLVGRSVRRLPAERELSGSSRAR